MLGLLFINIYGYYNVKVVLNVMGFWLNYVLMMGLFKLIFVKEQFFEFVWRYEKFFVKVKREEIVLFYECEIIDDINLFDFLLLFCLN